MWRTAKGGRDAKLVCGVGGGPLAWCAGLRTTFTLASEKKKDGSPLSAPFEQLVVGPLSIPPVAPRFGVGEPGFALQRVGTMKLRASARIKRENETKWETRRRHALLRRDERRNQAGKPTTEARYR